MRHHFLTRFFPHSHLPVTLIAGFNLVIFISACSGEVERPEVVGKLRALGVEQSPVNPTPGSVVSVTFHLAGPKGLAIKAAPYRDEAFRYGTNSDVTLVDAAPVEADAGALSHYTLRAQFTAPNDALTAAAIAKVGSARVRIAVAFSAAGDDGETVVSDARVYAPGSPQTAWKDPVISIDQPLQTSISSETALSASIASMNDEKNRVSWFVSSGELNNKNAKSTDWKKISSGQQTLILTVRGEASSSFAVKFTGLTVN